MDSRPQLIGVTPIATRTHALLSDPDGPRLIRHEGGSSSGKTRNIAHAWVRLLTESPGVLDVVRMSGPVLRDSAEEDIKIALNESGVDYEHNASSGEYRLSSGGRIKMLPLEGTKGKQKAHGRRRDYLWLNEANEISFGIFKQLRMRTRRRIVLDYNPAMEDDHWIFAQYDGKPASEVVTIRSTFEDNPFLEDEVIRGIRLLEHTDPYEWTVYGKGERGVPAHRVLPHVHALAEWPAVGNDTVVGWDFGFHDPTAMVRVARADGMPRAKLFVWALFHDSLHTNGDVLAKLADDDEYPEIHIHDGERVWADSAASDPIEEIKRAGYAVRAVKKGPGSIKAGVDWLKRHDIYVGGPAGDTARAELKRYRNVERNGRLVDEPLDRDNHVADALRYAAFTHWGNPTPIQIG
jgi:phage terminase large subunit